VRYSDAATQPLVAEWLAGCYTHEGVPSLTARLALPSGAVLVNRDGHQFTRYGVSFHGPDSGDAGILARQREIEALVGELDGLGRRVEEARDVHAAAERALALRREQIGVLQEQEADRQAAKHELQLEELRINESIARARERAGQIDVELAAIGEERQAEAASRLEAEARLGRYQAELQVVRTQLDVARGSFEAAGTALTAQRDAIQAAARDVQEAMFAERECIGKISEIERSVNSLSEQLTQAETDRSTTQGELAGLRDEGLRGHLQTGLATRVDREQKLSAARAHLDGIGDNLRGADEERLGAEQKLPPLRDRIGDLRLKEQAARLGVEQFAQQLAEAGADEGELARAFEANKVRPGALQAEIQRLQQAMTDLGAINMAALEELGIATDRKGFLDAQATDLREALETLENAIRRIDRETREMLQQTFDDANRHFGQLFPTLFGGGEARLVMTGEEILDTGIEVRAQPPGKRNSTIHLLSGGEKALTAIALIFALFQLNPAPFCLLDEVDAPLDDTNTERFCNLVRQMSEQTQFLFISHNKITMEIAAQLVGVTMPEQGVSRVVAVDIEEALRLKEAAAA
jgi:chromosome segregation protein